MCISIYYLYPIFLLQQEGRLYPDTFRPEHPRPDFKRSLWSNLNGRWDFCFDPLDQGLEKGFYLPGAARFNQQINVPFPWQSELAGLNERQPACEIAWYRLTFTIPPEMSGQEVFLRFGAVDFQARVWVNGKNWEGTRGATCLLSSISPP